MNILHYSLGFPPYRSGGMTKFCMDLMKEQKNAGHRVSLLWPGEMTLISRAIRIRGKETPYGIFSYEVINPLPVPYDEGIDHTNRYMDSGDLNAFHQLLEETHPDIIHVHTLMGLYESFLAAAKDSGIRVVFSAHDFFPICSKVTMFRNGVVCNTVKDCSLCDKCNETALKMAEIRLLQSPFYRTVKDSSVVKRVRRRHRNRFLGETDKKSRRRSGKSVGTAEDYIALRGYYRQMLDHADIIHFNSLLTKNIYEKYIKTEGRDVVIPITHADIKDNRRRKEFGKTLRMTYLGPQGKGKGFYILKEALDELWCERQDFILNVFFTPTERSPYLKVRDNFQHKDMEDLFEKTDVLIAPSMMYETFGYTVFEALSYGVPVIISDRVGAKDIVPRDGGTVVENMDVRSLKKAIGGLSAAALSRQNEAICSAGMCFDISKMSQRIMQECYEDC